MSDRSIVGKPGIPAAPTSAGSWRSALYLVFFPSRHSVMRVASSGLEPVVVPRSPTPMTEGSTPSEAAHTHRTASSGTSTLTTAEHRRRGHFLMAPHGSVAPWGAAGGNPAVFPTQGVRFLPGPQCLFYNGARHARQGGHRALTPDQTGFERAHTAVAQPDGATACQAEGHGFESVGGATSP